MATLPLMANATAGLDSILSQLAPNTPPPHASAWPPAIGYWLILAALIIFFVLMVIWQNKTKQWRTIKKNIAKVQQLTDPRTQSEQVHALLHWLDNKKNREGKINSPQNFKQSIENALQHPLPDWVNAHYRSDKDFVSVDWSDVQVIIKSWRKEIAK